MIFLPVVSDTAAYLLPRVALATQVAIETAREHGLQLNMASSKTEAVVATAGARRLGGRVLSWTVSGRQPSRSRRASRSDWFARIGTWEHRPSHEGEVRSSQLVDPTQERRTKPRDLPFALWGWYLALPQRFGHQRYGGYVHGALLDDCQ